MFGSVLNLRSAVAVGWLPFTLSGATALSCTPLKPQEDTPSGGGAAATDRAVTSLNPNTAWSCLESLERERSLVPNGNGRRWIYSKRVVDYVNGQPIRDLEVRACQLADDNCQQPVAEAVAEEDGWVEVTLAEDFSGYFEFRSPTTLPLMLFPSGLTPRSGSNDFPVALLDLQAATGLSAALGAPLDPTKGLIIMYMFDCAGMPAEELRVTSDRESSPWYTVNNLPSFTARATSPQGIGGFINLAPGISVVQVELEDGTPLASPQAVFVRAGWFTTFLMDPSGFEP